MASKLAEAFVEVGLEKSKFESGLNDVRQKTERTANDMQKRMTLADGFKKIGGWLGVGLTGFAIADMIQKTGEAEKSQLRLKTALQATGQNASENLPKFKEFAEGMKAAYGVSKESMQDAMTFGINLGVPAADIENFTRTAYGLGQVMGTDVQDAMHALTKAQEGNWMSLERAIPAIKAAKTEDEKWAALQKVAALGLRERRAEMDGEAGAMERLKQSIGGLEKALGALVAPAVTQFLNDLASAIRTLTPGTEEMKRSIASLVEVFLQARKGWAAMTGDTKTVEAMEDAIFEMEQKISESITRQNKAAYDAINAECKAWERSQKKKADDVKDAFRKIEDIWKDAQKKAIEGATLTPTDEEKKRQDAAAKAALAAAKPFGDIGFKPGTKAGTSSGGAPQLKAGRLSDDEYEALRKRSLTLKGAEADRYSAEHKARERGDPAYMSQGSGPMTRLQWLQSRLQWEKDKLAQMESENTPGVNADTTRKRIADLERTIQNVKPDEPMLTGTQMQNIDLSEALQRSVTADPNRPIRVKSEHEGELIQVLKTLGSLLPTLRMGRFSY